MNIIERAKSLFGRKAEQPSIKPAMPISEQPKPVQKANAKPIDYENKPPFLGITKEHVQEFCNKVAKAKGKAIIIVHPYFDRGTHEYEKNLAENKDYEKIVNRLLAQKNVPVIILEENKPDRMASTKSALAELKAPNHLILPTGDRTPRLVLRDGKVEGGLFTAPQQDFKKLYGLLKFAKVSTVHIGGLNGRKEMDAALRDASIENYERARLKWRVPIKKGYEIVNCVGDTYAGLVKNAIAAEKNGEKPLNIRIMSRGTMRKPWYSEARERLHK